jgi:hypothetical protein
VSRAKLLLCITLVVGCGDSTAPSTPDASMRFTFRGSTPGSVSGTFSVTGRRELYAEGGFPTGAIGNVTSEPSIGEAIRIVGSRSDPRAQLEFFLVGVTAPGVLQMCPIPTGSGPPPSNCVLRGYYTPVIPTYPYFLTEYGTDRSAGFSVTVSALTPTRIRGTFEGITIGRCYSCAAEYANVPDTMRISAGSFDVPYR